MAEKTEDELRQQFEEIRDETLISANTAVRVGQAMLDGLDSYQLKADLPSGLPDGGTDGQFLQRQYVGLPIRFPRYVATTNGNDWIVGNSPMQYSGWDPTWQDATGIAQGTNSSGIYDNQNWPAPADTNYVTTFVVHEPVSGKNFALLASIVSGNTSFIAEITSFSPPTLGPINQITRSDFSTFSDVSVFSVNGGYIWVSDAGGGIHLQLDPNSPTFWTAIDETSFGPSPTRGTYYDTDTAKYGDGYTRLWVNTKTNGWSRYSQQDFSVPEFIAVAPTGNWTAFYAGFSVDAANGRIYSVARSTMNGNFNIIRFDMVPTFSNQVVVQIAANTSLDPIDCIWDPTTNKVIVYCTDTSDFLSGYGYRGKLYIATDNGGSFSSVTEILLPREIGTPSPSSWTWQPKLSIIGNQLYIPVNGAFNGYTPAEPVGHVLRMDLATEVITEMTRTPTAGWSSVTGGDLSEDTNGLIRVTGLTDQSGNNVPIGGTFSTGANSGFLRFDGVSFSTATVSIPPSPFRIIETTSDMTSYFGSPSAGFYNIDASVENGQYFVKGLVDLSTNGLNLTGTQNNSGITFLSGGNAGFFQGGFQFNKTSGNGAIIAQASSAMLFQNMGLYQGGTASIPIFYTASTPFATGLQIQNCHLAAGGYVLQAVRTGSTDTYVQVYDCNIDASSTGNSPYGIMLLTGQIKAFIERNRIRADFRYDLRIENNSATAAGGGIVKIRHNHWLDVGFNYSYAAIRYTGTSTNFFREIDISHNTFSLPNIGTNFGSGTDTAFVVLNGNADTIRSLICMANTAYVTSGTGVTMYSFPGSADVARRATFHGNSIQSNTNTPTMFSISHIRSDWSTKGNIVNDSFVQQDSSLTAPTNPGQNNYVAIASSGDLTYTSITTDRVLGNKTGITSAGPIKVDDFVSTFYDQPENLSSSRALFAPVLPISPVSINALANGANLQLDFNTNADRWYRVEVEVLVKERVTGLPIKARRVFEYQATSGGTIVSLAQESLVRTGITISATLIAGTIRITVANSSGQIVNGWWWTRYVQYILYQTLPV